MEIIKQSQFNNAIRRAVDSRLEKDGRSPSMATVENSVRVIREIRITENELVVDPDWRKKIKDFVSNYNIERESNNAFYKEK